MTCDARRLDLLKMTVCTSRLSEAAVASIDMLLASWEVEMADIIEGIAVAATVGESGLRIVHKSQHRRFCEQFDCHLRRARLNSTVTGAQHRGRTCRVAMQIDHYQLTGCRISRDRSVG